MGNLIFDLVDKKPFKNIVSANNTKKNSIILKKSVFTQKAISKMDNWNDLSDPAKKLTKKVYSFIQGINS